MKKLQEAKEWLDDFETKVDGSDDINKCLEKELGNDFQLDDECYPPLLEQVTSEGKNALSVLKNTYTPTYDPDLVYEHWTQILLKIQKRQEEDKAKSKLQSLEVKLEHYKDSLDEIMDETVTDESVDWLNPTSIETMVPELKSVLSKINPSVSSDC